MKLIIFLAVILSGCGDGQTCVEVPIKQTIGGGGGQTVIMCGEPAKGK